MRTVVAIVIIGMACILLGSMPSESATCTVSGGAVTCRAVVDSIDALESGIYSGGKYDKISVTCYHAAALVSVCAGGGDFDRISTTGNDCRAAADGAYIVQDAGTMGSTQCFQRQNVGLNGVLDARQCGVVGDGLPANGTTGHPDDAARLQVCLNLSASFGLHIVNTGGGVILDNTTSIEVPENIELTCGGGNLADVGDDDYRLFNAGSLQLGNAIVMDPTSASGGPYTIRLDKRNATLSGCNIEAGTGASGTNPCSPSAWFPYCPSGSYPCTSPGAFDLRSATYEASAFNPNSTSLYPGGGPASGSVGVSIEADHITVRNVTILGFGTCYSLNQSSTTESRPVIDHLIGDCNMGISIVNSNNPHIDGVLLHPFLTSGSNSSLVKDITAIVPDSGSGEYQVTAHVDTGAGAYQFANGDTVWIATPAIGGGRESARGRWTIGSVSSPTMCGSYFCQSFLLIGSTTSATSLTGDVTGVLSASGYSPTVVSNILPSSLKFVAPGQAVSDPPLGGHNCIQSGTTVSAVWPARGLVFLSLPATCTQAAETVVFTDNAYASAGECSDDPQNGCVTIDAAFRLGEGFHAENVGSISAVNCNVFEHQIAYHLTAGANGGRWANCAAGDNTNLPQRNIQDVSNSIISLLIDGKHGTYDPNDASDNDACDNNWVNSVLGQHRPAAIVVQSNCPDANKLADIGIGVDNSQRSGIALEVDAGAVLMANAYGGGPGSVFKADQSYLYNSLGNPTGPYAASLNISGNLLSNMTLYSSNVAAGNTTVGCGNRFSVPTPYLCAPSAFVQPPGGRLTLCAAPPCPPVMTGDVAGATHVYYVPYTGQQVPIYSTTTGSFGLVDIGGAGLTLNLDNSGSDKQAANTLYDLFVDLHGGQPVLCSLVWATSGAGTSTRATQVVQIDGIWVNAVDVASCQYDVNLNDKCPALQCTYVGTMYMTGDGQTAQQFAPLSGSGGSAPCLCLYNAYNRVTLVSRSLDSHASYTYNSGIWRYMEASANNRISVVDGLAQMQISAQLVDALTNTGRNAQIAIEPNVVPPIPTPPMIVQANSQSQGSYTANLASPPISGFWYIQALEAASGAGTSATFGGSGYQQLSVQVED